MSDFRRLGASLYVPAIHPGLADVMCGLHPSNPRSVIVCTEDAIADADVDIAIGRLRGVLSGLPTLSAGPLRFVRPRSPSLLRQIVRMPGIERVHGFVIPKADANTLPAYLRALGRRPYRLMPILETAAIFDGNGLRDIRRVLEQPAVRPRVSALRIGGNDLLRLLGLKRLPGHSVYETPLGMLIPLLVMAFRPHGFRLTGVACDDFSDVELLRRETRQDRLMGLVGKTAIHPAQIPVIEDEFTVSESDLATAEALVRRASGGAFGMSGMMLEPAVHLAWAMDVIATSKALDSSHDTGRSRESRLQEVGSS